MIDNYARLLEVAAEHGDDAVADLAVKRLVAHLANTGQMDLLPAVARELRKIAARRTALAAKVEVAHRKNAEEALKEAARAGIRADKATVNTSLISGWRAQGDGKLVDRSGKRALLDIYQRITA